MKKRVEQFLKSPSVQIVFAMSLLCVFFLLLAHRVNSFWKSFLLGLAAAFIAVIPTVLFVNYIFSRRWKLANKATKTVLRELRDVHLRTSVLFWGYMPGAGDPDQLTKSLSLQKRKKYNQVLKAKLTENDETDITHGFDKGSWKLLGDMIERLDKSIPSFLSYHGTTITPETYGQLLEIQLTFEKLAYAYSIGGDDLTQDYIEYEKKFADPKYAHDARRRIIESISVPFYSYLSQLYSLNSSIGIGK